jgi:phosphopantetheinyl transferase
MIDRPARAGDIDVWVCAEPTEASDTIVRRALSRYPGVSAAANRVDRDARGRPVIRGREDLGISVSHSNGLILVAIGQHCRVGVDIEPVMDRGLTRLRYHALTDAELAELELHDRSRQTEVLLGYWTRKEALLKAVGLGLALDPRLIELPPANGSPHPLAVPDALGRSSDWWIVGLVLQGYVAAVAADVKAPRVRLLQLTGGSTGRAALLSARDAHARGVHRGVSTR